MTKGLEIRNKQLLKNNGIDTPLRMAHFFAQLYAESGLVPKRENCYYTTIKGLRLVFKTPFRGKDNEFVKQYLRNPEKCANYVYAKRGGNGDEASGDGYKYRGGGFIQTTGFGQYLKLSLDTGCDYLENPELLEQELHAMIAACWYWNVNKLNKFADKDDLDAISDIVNIGRLTDKVGDANGYEHRKSTLNEFKKYFKA